MTQPTQTPRQLSPDDPRHGTYAGFLAHKRADGKACGPCLEAQYQHNKRTKYRLDQGVPNRIKLGQRAWDVIDQNSRTELHWATGINRNMLSRLHTAGPDAIVLRSTRDRILKAGHMHTPHGIQRRLQALAVMGHSTEVIASETQINAEPLKKLRRNPDPKFVRHSVAKRIVDYYDAHMMERLEGVGAEVVRARARKAGWVAPLAWDDIDHDPAPVDAPDKQSRDTLGEYEFLVGNGESHENALKRLGVTDEAIKRARLRARKAA